METASHIVAILAKKNARYDTPYFDEIMDRHGLQGDDHIKIMEVYKKFQSEDIAMLESNERSYLIRQANKPTLPLPNMITGVVINAWHSFLPN